MLDPCAVELRRRTASNFHGVEVVAFYPQFFDAVTEKKSTYLNAVLFLHSLRRSAITLNCNSSTCILVIARSTNGHVCTDRLQSDRPSRDVFPSCFSEIDRLINQAVIRRVTFAVEKLSLGGRRKQLDVSTNQSNNFGVSPKRF